MIKKRVGPSVHYFPHDMTALSDDKLTTLVAKEGMRGYGIYWAVIEYLRKQPDYTGSIYAIKSLARSFCTTTPVVTRVVTNYNLFVFNNRKFLSPGLSDRMAPLDRRLVDVRQHARRAANLRWAQTLKIPDAVEDANKRREDKSKTLLSPKEEESARLAATLESSFPKLKPPEYALNRETHNYDGLLDMLVNIKIDSPMQMSLLMKLSNYGEIGNPLWRVLAKRSLAGWLTIKHPGQSIIRSLYSELENKRDDLVKHHKSK